MLNRIVQKQTFSIYTVKTNIGKKKYFFVSIFFSFYRSIVGKNIVCGVGLNISDFTIFIGNIFLQQVSDDADG